MAESDTLIKLVIVFTMLVPPLPFLVFNHYLNDLKLEGLSGEALRNAIFFRRARWVVYFFVAIIWLLTFTVVMMV